MSMNLEPLTKFAIRYIGYASVLWFPTLLCGQSHEEQIVRSTYAKINYAAELNVVTEAAFDSHLKAMPIDSREFYEKLSGSTATFTFTDFKVGELSDIKDSSWCDDSTPEVKISGRLSAGLQQQSYKENDQPAVVWTQAALSWKGKPADAPKGVLDKVCSMPLNQLLALTRGTMGPTPDSIYTRYAAYTMTIMFEGKVVGPYKAMFLFGHDGKGKEVVSPQDSGLADNGPLNVMLDTSTPLFPTGLLRTSLRDEPVVREWLASTAISTSSNPGHVVCLDSHCGISEGDLQAELAAPLAVTGKVETK